MEANDNPSKFLLYQTEDGETRIEVKLEEETVWLTQKLLAELFQRAIPTINEHLKNIFAEGELEEISVIRNFLITASDGKQYNTAFYNLDAIISIGYRVKSHRGTQFRIWATKRLKEYIVKGFILDDTRMKHGGDQYFEELLSRIRDIRSSERVFYRKVLDIYALSIDYDSKSEITQHFFQIVQNKMHWAVTGKTASEIIYERANASEPNMGLTSWKGKNLKASDVTIAKNYLHKDEIEILNRLVNQYLEFAELQAMSKKTMHMQDWISKLDAFLNLNEKEILKNIGSISAKLAKVKAESEFTIFYKNNINELENSIDKDFENSTRKLLNSDDNKKP